MSPVAGRISGRIVLFERRDRLRLMCNSFLLTLRSSSGNGIHIQLVDHLVNLSVVVQEPVLIFLDLQEYMIVHEYHAVLRILITPHREFVARGLATLIPL